MSRFALMLKCFYVAHKEEMAVCRENEEEQGVGKRNKNINIKKESLFFSF